MTQVKVKPDEITIQIVHKFISKELHVLREDLVTALTEVTDLEETRKSRMSDLNADVTRAKKEVSRITNACHEGKEIRPVKTQLIRNYDSGNREYWSFKDDATVNKFGGLGTLLKCVRKEPLTPADRQLELTLIEEENARREDAEFDAPDDTWPADASKKSKKSKKPTKNTPEKPNGDHPRPDEDGGL